MQHLDLTSFFLSGCHLTLERHFQTWPDFQGKPVQFPNGWDRSGAWQRSIRQYSLADYLYPSVRAVNEHDDIRVLFQTAGFAQVRKHRAVFLHAAPPRGKAVLRPAPAHSVPGPALSGYAKYKKPPEHGFRA